MMERVEKVFAGRNLTIETGRMAKQAAGSAVVRYGDTMVLATVTVSETVSPLPFFPLTVEYKEKTYAAGKIPGSFFKREGRPSELETLTSRQARRIRSPNKMAPARSPPGTPARGCRPRGRPRRRWRGGCAGRWRSARHLGVRRQRRSSLCRRGGG